MDDLGLADTVSFLEWWQALEAQSISVVERFYEFVDRILLAQITQPIVIFIEEIDSLVSLPFDTDGFFSIAQSDARGNQAFSTGSR